jgi:hypothetical protein
MITTIKQLLLTQDDNSTSNARKRHLKRQEIYEKKYDGMRKPKMQQAMKKTGKQTWQCS